MRARILEAAAELFRTHGYDVSMDAIASVANVSKQTLYNQFGSKEDLFKAMIAEHAAIMRAPLNASALERHPRDMLADVARQYYTHACGAGRDRLLPHDHRRRASNSRKWDRPITRPAPSRCWMR